MLLDDPGLPRTGSFDRWGSARSVVTGLALATGLLLPSGRAGAQGAAPPAPSAAAATSGSAQPAPPPLATAPGGDGSGSEPAPSAAPWPPPPDDRRQPPPPPGGYPAGADPYARPYGPAPGYGTPIGPPPPPPPGYGYDYGYDVPPLPPPSELPYEPGQTVPTGYHLDTQIRKGLVIAGAVTFGSLYLFAAGTAAAYIDDRDEDANAWAPLFVPIGGPFIALGTVEPSATGTVALLIDGLGQAAGLAMLIAGLAAQEEVLVRDDLGGVTWRLGPTVVGQDAPGLGLSGTM